MPLSWLTTIPEVRFRKWLTSLVTHWLWHEKLPAIEAFVAKLWKEPLPAAFAQRSGFFCSKTFFTFFSLLLYFPGCYLLQLWLPKYSDSLVYLGIMLPTIIFSSKVSLLTNNYLKAYRREKDMLVINVLVMIIGFSLYLVSAYIFDNINLLLYSLVIIIMFRSVVSEMVVMKLIDCRLHREFVIEGMITVLFIICAQLSNSHLGFIGYALIFSIYLAYYFSKKYNKSKMVWDSNEL